VLDVREDWEVAVCGLRNSLHIPLGRLPDHLDRLPADRPLVVVCHQGLRSLQVMSWLRSQGFDFATSLRGGLAAWADRIDLSMPRY
jgi:rhodanese-related sulfurtransferase